MTPIEKAAHVPVDKLIPWLGYREKASKADLDSLTGNAGSNNYTFIAEYFDNLWRSGFRFYNTLKNGPIGEWCDMTVDYAVCQAFGPEMALKILHQPMESAGAGCEFSANYYRAAGAWIERDGTPMVGDQAFFGARGNESHTGLVEFVTDTTVGTIEGNTGNMLDRKTYSRSDSRIAGYGRPDYGLVAHLYAPILDDVEQVKEPVCERDRLLAVLGDEWIENYGDLPEWAKPEVRDMFDAGILKGTAATDSVEGLRIHATMSTVRAFIVGYRAALALGGAQAARDELRRIFAVLFDDGK